MDAILPPEILNIILSKLDDDDVEAVYAAHPIFHVLKHNVNKKFIRRLILLNDKKWVSDKYKKYLITKYSDIAIELLNGYTDLEEDRDFQKYGWEYTEDIIHISYYDETASCIQCKKERNINDFVYIEYRSYINPIYISLTSNNYEYDYYKGNVCKECVNNTAIRTRLYTGVKTLLKKYNITNKFFNDYVLTMALTKMYRKQNSMSSEDYNQMIFDTIMLVFEDWDSYRKINKIIRDNHKEWLRLWNNREDVIYHDSFEGVVGFKLDGCCGPSECDKCGLIYLENKKTGKSLCTEELHDHAYLNDSKDIFKKCTDNGFCGCIYINESDSDRSIDNYSYD